MHCAYIGLGSNLDDPPQQLRHALAALAQLDTSRLTGSSNIYQSRPWGPAGQQDYLNAAVRLSTQLSPHDLLATLQAIETSQGRIRGERWGPRTLDLDLLLYDEQVLDSADLVIPHPEITKRNFVLRPLLDIEPDLTLPGGLSIASALATTGTSGLVLFATAAQFGQACS